MHKVEVFEDQDYEMIKIVVDGELKFQGNFWDLGEDVWIDILRQCDVKVTTSEYSYE